MKVSLNPDDLLTLLSLFAGAPRRCALYARLGRSAPLTGTLCACFVCFQCFIHFLFINRLIHFVMSKSTIPSSASLFTTPVPLETKPPRECIVVTVSKSEDGETLVERKSIEKEMRKIIQLNFEEASLSSLIAHGIDPHGLDMVEVSKLGIDRDFDQLASIIEANPDRFFEKPKTED